MSVGAFRGKGRSAPLYARLLRLRHLKLTGLRCLLLCEVPIGLAILLVLAEIVPWWSVLAIPLTIAAMVKLNDALTAVFPAPQPAAAPAGARTAAHNAGRIVSPPTQRRAAGGPRRRRPVAAMLRPAALGPAVGGSMDETIEVPASAFAESRPLWDWRVRQSAARHYD
ncbi:hypothetical protein [Pilimelia columellifera]|uniref:Uncharacterized protein n=1 Tax=Pilimelia columellifera subsp. columellifera TaxID=706583 RepID=A0ABN3NSY2_9ACTN